jgi:hypothetical protein
MEDNLLFHVEELYSIFRTRPAQRYCHIGRDTQELDKSYLGLLQPGL